MFRGKESSNRIELSRLVQDLLNFGVLGPLQLRGLGGGWGVGVVWGCPNIHAHACACMHAHTRTCMHDKYDNFMQMAASIGFLENPWEFPMMSYMHAHVCACMHVCICAHVWEASSYHPPSPSTHPPPPWGEPSESVKIQ